VTLACAHATVPGPGIEYVGGAVYGQHLVAAFSTLITAAADYLMEHGERLIAFPQAAGQV
jgi:hypothetical protein